MKNHKSTSQWIEKHRSDHYFQKAKEMGYRSRSSIKLIQIDDKYKLLKPGKRILELGSYPGGWSQVINERVFSKNTNSKTFVLAIDIKKMDSVGSISFLELSFLSEKFKNTLNQTYKENFDLILSDMAPNTMGHKQTDHLRIITLCEQVLDFSAKKLNKKGSLILKFFRGAEDKDMISLAMSIFLSAKQYKPKASNSDSSEMYLICSGLR